MNCMASLVKYILYVFNLIFVICGILLIVFGALMLSGAGEITSFDDAVNMKTIPILVILLGSIIFLISFLGCCGAIKENNCCITLYAGAMFVLFVLQITLVVWIFVKREEFLNAMADVVEKAWQERNQSNASPMDTLQLSFKCCGLNGPSDYSNQTVPISCCGKLSIPLKCTSDIYEGRLGCKNEFVDFWSSNMNIIRYTGIGIALVEIIAFSFACSLSTSIRKNRY